MKIIKELTDMIEDELEGAKHYAAFSILHKTTHKSLADALMEISTQEMRHVTILHEEVTKLIKQYRDEHGPPPAEMQAIYNWQHEKNIEKANEIRILQSQYKDGI